jgi:hypothetical protein
MRRAVLLSALLVMGCSREAAPPEVPWDEARQDPRCAGRLEYFQPKNGVLSTEVLAKRVGYQYLRDTFPDDHQLDPLQAILRNGVWHVAGTPTEEDYNVVHVLLCQSNGRVLEIWGDQ